MADNQNNSMFAQPQYGNTGNTNTTATQINPAVQPSENQNVVSIESLMANLQQQSQEQSKNLINQREIINDAFEKNKELQNLLAQKDAEIEQLKKQATNQSSNITYEEQMKSMQEQIANLEKYKQMQAFKPIVEEFHKFGVKEADVQNVLSQIKNMGVDLWANPNPELAKVMLNHLYSNNNETQSVPQGGFTTMSNSYIAPTEAAIQQEINEKNKALQDEINKKKQNQRR